LIMALEPARRIPLMCLTQDGLALSHAEQAAELCRAGVRWIQLRMKNAAGSEDVRLDVAREVVRICRDHGTICIVNDRPDLAAAADADGAHVGRNDGDWQEARRILGPHRLLGGTVNNGDDASLAVAAGCLDYVGVGPLRYTATKARLAPILGESGIRALLSQLDGLPAWAIGGVRPEDLPGLRGAGAAGVAVSSAIYERGRIAENVAAFQAAWTDRALNPTIS
jgi:thiamine-phosphate pyrophosphorylase